MNTLLMVVKRFYIYAALVGMLLPLSASAATEAGKVAPKTASPKPVTSSSALPILDNREIDSIPVKGPRTVGGGNSCAMSIKANTKKLVSYLRSDRFAGMVDLEELQKVIDSTRFYMQDVIIKDGQNKDALNFPDERKIIVSNQVCAGTLSKVNGKAMSLLLHEYLGLAGYDDGDYRISGKFLDIYNSYEGEVREAMDDNLKNTVKDQTYINDDGSITIVGAAADELMNKIWEKGAHRDATICVETYELENIVCQGFQAHGSCPRQGADSWPSVCTISKK
jgi:hypothetical protein